MRLEPVPAAGTCLGCVHRSARFKGRRAEAWCGKWHQARSGRCTDYLFKGKANAIAMRFYAGARPK